MSIFTHITRPAASLVRSGATLPKDAQDALILAEKVDASLNITSEADLAEGILTGRISIDEITKEVHQVALDLAMIDRAKQAAYVTVEPITRLFRAAIREHADDLVAQLRERFDAAAEIVQEAGRHFGPETSHKEILHAGIDAVAAWQVLSGAINELNDVRTARGHIAEIEGTALPFWSFYVEDMVNGSVRDEIEASATRAGQMFHNLAHSGFTLRLNTTAEAQELFEQARITDAQEAERLHAEQVKLFKRNSRDAHDLDVFRQQFV